MLRRDVVVIGGSAGAHEPLREIVRGLSGFKGTVLVTLHVPAGVPSALPMLLSRYATVPVRHAVDGEPLEPGTILIAPPDRHLLVTESGVRLSSGPKENGSRPAVDALFRSAASVLGRRVCAVILSGALDDGTLGMARVKEHGGTTVVQDPEEARFRGMPQSAIENVKVDHVLPMAQIARLLVRLANGDADAEGPLMSPPREDDDGQLLDPARLARDEGVPGRRPTVLSCPECRGVLLRLQDDAGSLLHFQCQTGHAYSPIALADAERQDVTDDLESAFRSLRERSILLHMMADRAKARGKGPEVDGLRARADELERLSGDVKSILESLGGPDDTLE